MEKNKNNFCFFCQLIYCFLGHKNVGFVWCSLCGSFSENPKLFCGFYFVPGKANFHHYFRSQWTALSLKNVVCKISKIDCNKGQTGRYFIFYFFPFLFSRSTAKKSFFTKRVLVFSFEFTKSSWERWRPRPRPTPSGPCDRTWTRPRRGGSFRRKTDGKKFKAIADWLIVENNKIFWTFSLWFFKVVFTCNMHFYELNTKQKQIFVLCTLCSW